MSDSVDLNFLNEPANPPMWVCPLDDAGRFVLPEPLRQRLGPTLVITYGAKCDWLLFSTSDWDVFSAALIKKNAEVHAQNGIAEIFPPNKSHLLRRVLAPAQQCTLEAQGGLVLPESLRHAAALDSAEPQTSTDTMPQKTYVQLYLSWQNDHVCMNAVHTSEAPFGCSDCWAEPPQDAWDKICAITERVSLWDEDHFFVRVLRCPTCSQWYLHVFTETIDWAEGNDPTYITVLPLLLEEAQDILARHKNPGEKPLDEAALNALGKDRQSLRRDYPSWATAPKVYWGIGLIIGPHH